jgi:hypothetical protein
LAVNLEVVARDVSLNAGHLALFGLVVFYAVLHSHHAFEALSVLDNLFQKLNDGNDDSWPITAKTRIFI